jgi:hypothetical protein
MLLIKENTLNEFCGYYRIKYLFIFVFYDLNLSLQTFYSLIFKSLKKRPVTEFQNKP